jgi:hypothetical protein
MIFLVAFVAITPQYNSLKQRSKSNMVHSTTLLQTRVLAGTSTGKTKREGGYPNSYSTED